MTIFFFQETGEKKKKKLQQGVSHLAFQKMKAVEISLKKKKKKSPKEILIW